MAQRFDARALSLSGEAFPVASHVGQNTASSGAWFGVSVDSTLLAYQADVPSIADEIPGFSSTVWYGIVASPKTPSAIANKLSSAIAEAARQPAVAKLFAGSGLDVVGSTPAEMAVLVRQENERWSKVVRATGATAE